MTDKTAADVPTQQITFRYDALDRRILKGVDLTPQDALDAALTHFVYDGDDVLLDFVDSDGSGPNPATLDNRYLHGPATDQVFAQDGGTGDVQWLLADHLGTVHDLVNNSGVIANHIVYDSYGNVISQTNAAIDTRYDYTGRENERELGLMYYRSRYYDPSRGRFIPQ